MAAYVALYREWRPQSFADLVGQEHISRTLQNALVSGRIAHAYLFTGPRGTGKTTTAKILAKAVNCLSPVAVEPCNQCENCSRINEGSSLDVLEVDGASNRGIDEVRDLREKVKFAPGQGRYKVYIIDEVHMLTSEAFNALLKTLEEPPSHVIFILATTEPHKIPATILSRCQRYDFRRIGTKEIIGRLQQIADHDQLIIEGEALQLIARKAEGGLRDALSLLDQCLAFSGPHIGVKDVALILGTVEEEFLLELGQALGTGDITKGLSLLDGALAAGKDVRQLVKDLTYHFRNLLLAQVLEADSELLPMGEETRQRLMQQSALFSRDRLYQGITTLGSAEAEMKWTSQPRILLEVALIQIARIPDNRESKAGETALAALEVQSPAPKVEAPSLPREPKAAGSQRKSNSAVSAAGDPGELAKVKERWQDILNEVQKIRRTAQATLAMSEPVSLQGRILTLMVKDDLFFYKQHIEQKDNRLAICQGFKKVLNMDLDIRCLLERELEKNQTINDAEEKADKDKSNLIITKAIEIFGPDVVEVKE